MTPIFGYPTWGLIDKITRPVKKLAGATKVTIRLVLSEHQWTVFARRRDGAVVTRKHPVSPTQALHALWLMDPAELHATISMMLLREQAAIRERANAVRAELGTAEQQLAARKAAQPAAELSELSGFVPASRDPADAAPAGLGADDLGADDLNAEDLNVEGLSPDGPAPAGLDRPELRRGSRGDRPVRPVITHRDAWRPR